MPDQTERIIFGSYNSKDRAKVLNIAEALKPWGITLWLDMELTPGAIFGRVLEEKIEHAQAAVFFIGAERGKWQEQEIFWLVNRFFNKQISLLIPVLLEGAGAGAGGFLSNFQHVDFREGSTQQLSRLALALLKPQGEQNSETQQQTAAALLTLVVQSETDAGQVLRYARGFIRKSQWEQARLACSRAMSLALDNRSGSVFVDACMLLGEVHFRSNRPDLAERQWKIGLAVCSKFNTGDIENCRQFVQRIGCALPAR